MSRIKVSVIIPVFNGEKFIKTALLSVVNQSFDCFTEIIVVDDASTDNTKSVVNNFSVDNNYIIILLDNKRKKGPSGARNTGLISASGDYIAFLDADDIWVDGHLDRAISFLEIYRDIGVVFFNFEVRDYITHSLHGDWFSSKSFTRTLNVIELNGGYFKIIDDMFAALIEESFVHLQSLVCRKSLLSSILFNEGVKRSEDRDFVIRLFIVNCAVFAYSFDCTGVYYRRQDSLTYHSLDNSLSTIIDQNYLFVQYMKYENLSKSSYLRLKNNIFQNYLSAAYYCRKLRYLNRSFYYVMKSFRYGFSFNQVKSIFIILYLRLIK